MILVAIAGAAIIYTRLKIAVPEAQIRFQSRGWGNDVPYTVRDNPGFLLLLVITLNEFRGIPLSLAILCAIALLVTVITRNTPLWKISVCDRAANEEAAILSGIPVTKVIVCAYALLGGIVALTGLMQTAYAGALNHNNR